MPAAAPKYLGQKEQIYLGKKRTTRKWGEGETAPWSKRPETNIGKEKTPQKNASTLKMGVKEKKAEKDLKGLCYLPGEWMLSSNCSRRRPPERKRKMRKKRL